jgi:signal transduction histidine kinase
MSPIRLPRLFRIASVRFAALYVAVFAGSALLLGGSVYLKAREVLQQNVTDRIQAETAFLKEEYRKAGVQHLVRLIETRGRGTTALDYLLQDRTAQHLSGEMPSSAGLTPGWHVIKVPHASEDEGRRENVRALVSDLGDGIILAVGSDLGQVDELQEAVAAAFLWTLSLAAVVGIAGGVLVSRAFLSRIDSIVRTAEAIISGDMARRVPMRGTGDDLDRLSGTVNRMLDKISTLMESLRQVSSDVAHDLRTPLTRLYQRLEEARMRAGSRSDYESAIEGALNETQGLLDTFSALLRIAQVEGASPRAAFRDVNLSAVAEAVHDAYQPVAEETAHQLEAIIAPGIRVDGDRELLTQALANLIENALRHTAPGSKIRVELTNHAETGLCLSVADNGPGVPPSDMPRLTERFYRGERSRTTAGNGLGLTLVSAVAELHGAKLCFEALRPGLRVSLLFRHIT